jgi:hypothetical protein
MFRHLWIGLPSFNTLHKQIKRVRQKVHVFNGGGGNRRACFRHLCRKTIVYSCHRCLINTGIEKIEQHLNIDHYFDHQMSLSERKFGLSTTVYVFSKCPLDSIDIKCFELMEQGALKM